MIDAGKVDIVGVRIDAVDYEAAVQRIIDAAVERRPYRVSALAVHGVMTGVDDPQQLARLNAFDLLTPDGQPVRWAMNWLHGTGLPDRVDGPDLTLAVCRAAVERGSLGVLPRQHARHPRPPGRSAADAGSRHPHRRDEPVDVRYLDPRPARRTRRDGARHRSFDLLRRARMPTSRGVRLRERRASLDAVSRGWRGVRLPRRTRQGATRMGATGRPAVGPASAAEPEATVAPVCHPQSEVHSPRGGPTLGALTSRPSRTFRHTSGSADRLDGARQLPAFSPTSARGVLARICRSVRSETRPM